MIRANWLVLESFRPPEPKDVWFPLSRHNVPRLHEKFFLADSSELVGVRVISASRAQKVWYPLSRHDVRRVHKKKFLSPIRANWWVLESFRPPEPKNVSLLLSRHDVRRFHEKFFLAHSSELMPVRVISVSWAQKRLFPLSRHHVRRVNKKFFSRWIRAKLMNVRVISASWAQKRLIPTF